MKHKNSKRIVFGSIVAALTLATISFSAISLKSKNNPVIEANADDLTTLYASCESQTTVSGLWSALKTVANKNYSSGTYDGLLSWYMDVYWDSTNNRLNDYYSLSTSFTTSSQSCGSYKNEGDCFNREHSIPKSWWGGSPDKTQQGCDIYIVIPTDGYVNNRRSNYALGEVKSATYTSNSGFKLGSSNRSDYTGSDPVFEPLDSIKGDMARIYFYARAKWNSVNMTSGDGGTMFSGSDSTNYGLTDYAKKMLYEWHTLDPVSEWELSVNNKAAAKQGNRNPFIDHPEYADYIWGDKEIGSVTNASISISDENKSLEVGGTTTISATSSDSSAISWSTSNSNVVSLSSSSTSSGSNITLTANAAGTATITASATIDGNTLTKTCVVTVTKKISTLSYTGNPTKTSYNAGESFDSTGLNVTVTYTDNTTDNVTSLVSWSPSPLTAGVTSVTGTYGGKTITVSGLTVIAAAYNVGDKITSIDDIVSGATYKIGATVSSTDYYFVGDGSSTGTGLSGTSSTSSADSPDLLFTGSGSSWTVKFSSGYYLSLASSKANGKFNVESSAATWTLTDTSSSLINMKINEYCLQKNSSSSLNFGSYSSGQTDVWLEYVSGPSSSVKTVSSIEVKTNPKVSYNVGEYFDPSGLVITVKYSDNSSEDITYSSGNASSFTFNPTTTTALATSNTSVSISYGGKTTSVSISVTASSSDPTPTTNSIKAIYDGGVGTYDFEGLYVGETNGSPVIMNGEYGMLLYGVYSSTYSSWTVNESYISVSATITTYKNLYETDKNSTITVSATKTDTSVISKVANPKTYTVTGNENSSDLSVANRLSHVVGTVYSINGTTGTSGWSTSSDNTVIMTVGSKQVQVFVKKSYSSDTTIENAFKSGEEIIIEGFTSFYNTTFQVAFSSIVETDATYLASTFAQELLDLVSPICTGYDGITDNSNALNGVWTTLEGSDHYLKLSSEQKTILQEADENESGTVIEQAMAFYDKAVAKYHLTNFINRTISYSENVFFASSTDNTILTIVLISVASVSIIGGFIFLKRRKEN